jgi:hypothetical protein
MTGILEEDFVRAVAILAALSLAGCASEDALQLPALTKTTSHQKAVSQGYYQCVPEPEAGCISVKSRQDCVAHSRCQWAEGEGAGGFCRRIYCFD